MSSASPSAIGMRETPLSRKSVIASWVVAAASIVTMSVRGTMTARTKRSVKSNTEWMRSRSSASMRSCDAASSTMLRSCSSDAKDAPRWMPGVRRSPRRTSRCARGPSTMRAPRMSPAHAFRKPFACCRPTARGDAPTRTKEATVMTTTAASIAHQMFSKTRVRATVTRTAAAVSMRMRMKTTAVRCASGSAAILRRAAPERASSARSARSAREVTSSAASSEAIRPPSATRRPAAMNRRISVMRAGGARSRGTRR